MLTRTAEDRGGVTDADFEQTSGRIDREGRVLGEEGVDLASEVTEAGTAQEVVAAVSELKFQRGHQRRSKVEQFGRGAGVI